MATIIYNIKSLNLDYNYSATSNMLDKEFIVIV